MNSKHAFLALSTFTLVSIAYGEREVFAPTKLAPTATAGTVQFGDGTAAAPSLTFTSDNNTGFYRFSTDQVACTLNGTTTGVFSGGSLVLGSGFGSTPGDGAVKGVNATGTNVAGGNFIVSGGASTGNAAGGYLAFQTAAAGGSGSSVNALTERMRINSAGNVGIGTTTNLSTLTINGPIAPKGSTDVNAATYTVATTDSSLRFTTTNCTVTLPAAASFPGRILWLNTVTANSVTSNASNVIPLGSNTAGTAIFAATAGKFAMIQSNGTNWVMMMSN